MYRFIFIAIRFRLKHIHHNDSYILVYISSAKLDVAVIHRCHITITISKKCVNDFMFNLNSSKKITYIKYIEFAICIIL